MSRDILRKIDESIENFFNINWDSKDFLTEDDIRCRLFAHLEKDLSVLNHNLSINSEIRFYGEDKKLKYRCDLVVLDKNKINTDLPSVKSSIRSKGYEFSYYYSIIEIKLRRINDKKSDNKYNKLIKDDIDKLCEIMNNTGGNVNKKNYYIIAYDRKRDKKLIYKLESNCKSDYLSLNMNNLWNNWII